MSTVAEQVAELVEERARVADELDNYQGDTEGHNNLLQRAADVAKRIDEHNERLAKADEARAKLAAAKPNESRAVVRPGEQTPTVAQNTDHDVRSIAERFTSSESFDFFRKRGGKGMASIEIEGPETRALISTTGVVQTVPTPGILEPVRRPLLIADLLDQQTMTSSLISYVQDTTVTPDGSAAEVAEGSLKTESQYGFTIKNAAAAVIAHWVNITRQALDDNQQLAGYIQGRLRYGLDFRLDSEVLNGDGAGADMRGILNTSGVQTYAPGSAEQRLLSIRHSITKAQQSYYIPDGVVLNPADWELVETSRASGSGEFVYSMNPQASVSSPTIWGVRVASSMAIASGTGLTGSFKMGATLWHRQLAQIFITDSHASNFTSNILTLLAELRAALTVWRPAAFVVTTFNGGA